MVAVGVALTALVGGALFLRGGPATIDAGFIEVFHAIVVGSRQAHARVFNICVVAVICIASVRGASTASKSIAIVVAQTALALFALWRNGTSAIDIGFVAILNAVVGCRSDAHAFTAVLARAIGRFDTREVVGTR
jgi:hypothetical protein